MTEENEKNLAILFFLNNYNGSLQNLPGVENDQKELTEILRKNYKKYVINSSKNVLEDIKEIVEKHKPEELERVHFHFSGHGKDNVRVLTEENKNPSGEDDLPLTAQMSAGECVLGTGVTTIATSIHEIKVELNKMNAQKITMTLDCCRTVERGAETFVVDLRGKEMIKPEHHLRTFIFFGTMETQPAEDSNGKSFTQILSSLCKENGGAINILDIEKKVNEKMSEMKMDQSCKVDRVLKNKNWEEFMWPHQIDKTAEPVEEIAPKSGTVNSYNYNYGKQGFNLTNVKGGFDNLTMNL